MGSSDLGAEAAEVLGQRRQRSAEAWGRFHLKSPGNYKVSVTFTPAANSVFNASSGKTKFKVKP